MKTWVGMVVALSISSCGTRGISSPSLQSERSDDAPEKAVLHAVVLEEIDWRDDGNQICESLRLTNNSSRSIYFMADDDYLPHAAPRGVWEVLSSGEWKKVDPWYWEGKTQIMLRDMGRVCSCELPPGATFQWSGRVYASQVKAGQEVRYSLPVSLVETDDFTAASSVYSPILKWPGR